MQIVREIPPVADSREELRNERLFESVHDVVRFEQLLVTAEQLCLREPPAYGEYLPPVDAETKLIAEVGTLGVRYALECVGGESNGFEPFDDSLPHPLREPELYAGRLNRRLIAKAAAFGDALIRESYTILGTDAEAWVEEFKTAENDEAQIAVLEKLNERLRELAASERGLEEGGNGNYQSFRLSPKIIGEYPDYELPPTCLGIAAIGAGFLKKAGATFLHAGVMETAHQTAQLELAHLIGSMDKQPVKEALGVSMPDDIANRLKEKRLELFGAAMGDIGAHSALFVRLSSGSWYQFDPVYNVSTATAELRDENGSLVSRDDQILEGAYKKLTDFQESAPGLELTASFPTFSFYQGWLDYLSHLGPIQDESVHALLSSETPPREAIRRFIVDDWLLRETEDFYDAVIRDSFLNSIIFPASEDQEEALVLDIVVKDTIDDFVFQGMEENEWLERCWLDKEFRQKAVQDIQRLPALVGVLYGLEIIDTSMQQIHTRVELGLPETSIGLAALHNIGLDLDSDLSAHHWLSQWPSHLMPHDMLYKASRSPLQQQVVRRHTERLTQNGGLAFIHTYVTMIESQEDNTRNLVGVEELGEVSYGTQDEGSAASEDSFAAV